MAEFNGWYFQHNGKDAFIYVVSKEFWDANGNLDDSHVEFEIREFLPEGFYEECESMFSCEFSKKKAIKLLTDAGFKEMKLFDDEE